MESFQQGSPIIDCKAGGKDEVRITGTAMAGPDASRQTSTASISMDFPRALAAAVVGLAVVLSAAAAFVKFLPLSLAFCFVRPV